MVLSTISCGIVVFLKLSISLPPDCERLRTCFEMVEEVIHQVRLPVHEKAPFHGQNAYQIKAIHKIVPFYGWVVQIRVRGLPARTLINGS